MKGNKILKELSCLNVSTPSIIDASRIAYKEEIKHLDIKNGWDVLVLGTTDWELYILEEKFPKARFIGITLEEKFQTKKNIAIQDMHDLEFKDKSFDFVYGSQILEHSPAPVIVLAQVNRVLREGGEFFFWIPHDIDNQKSWYHFSCFPKEIWETLFDKMNFEIQKTFSLGNSIGYQGKKLGGHWNYKFKMKEENGRK